MKKVIITVDTEGHDGSDPIRRLIWGETDTGLFGIDRIMDISDRYNAKALFFVDLAEAWDYGEEKISEVIRHICGRGHDVGVHIHPDHMEDKSRLFLWEYSYAEQFDIIKKCTDLFIKITGEQPIAFRAGKYGANRDTLDILNELGYKYDFSQFYGQKWCRIEPPITVDLPARYKQITEIPVTVFRSFALGRYKRYDKVDALMYTPEYKHIMGQIAHENKEAVVTLFYHSFSMLDWREDPDNPKFNNKEEKKFIDAIKYVKDSENFSLVSLAELKDNFDDIRSVIDFTAEDGIVSTKGIIRNFFFSLKRFIYILKFNKKAKVLFYSLLVSIGLIIFLLIVYLF